ncbi:hypothetical protein OHA72_40830 [Dactylosporangium sp. NBC_01737]|uniref:hypothetical protein n=1 Tax=Dactylosporangium sp. NBC_01737 TaxID=2975959 RepID=UPI002E0D48B5|nr:hypothetical protein OHA72_40830 [Dactylosporangium sp. NBC_01737]
MALPAVPPGAGRPGRIGRCRRRGRGRLVRRDGPGGGARRPRGAHDGAGGGAARPTLAGHDPALERTAALPWPPRRIAHLVACGAAVAGLLVAARVLGADFGPVPVLLRNAAGLVGLVGLGAALAGARAAWQVPIAWAALASFLAAPGGPAWRQVALWMVQEPGNRIAAVTAAAFLTAGVVAYAVRVGPPTAPAEATMDQ